MVAEEINLRGIEFATEPVARVHREVTSRRVSCARNAIKRLQKRHPLFADQVAEEEGTPEQRIERIDSEHADRWCSRDAESKRKFLQAAERFADLPAHVFEDAVAEWNSSGRVASGEELANFVNNALAGRSRVMKGVAHPEIADESQRAAAEQIERSRAIIADMVAAGKALPIQRDAELQEQLRAIGVIPNVVGRHEKIEGTTV